MALHPVQELNFAQIEFIKQLTKQTLLKRAMRAYPKTKQTDWIIRETIFGDTPLGDAFIDVEVATAVATNQIEHGQDAADLTADDLSNTVQAGETIDDVTFVGFYGLADLAPEAGELTGSETWHPPIGSLSAVRLVRGTNTLEHWGTEHLYAYPFASGIAERPVIFEQKDNVQIQMCFSEATEDKQIAVRGFTCEKNTRKITLDQTTWSNISSGGQYRWNGINNFIAGGIHPAYEISQADLQTIKNQVTNTLINMAIDDNVARSAKDLRVREVIFGDGAAATDKYDINSATAQVSGQENWAQDAGDKTTRTLSNTIDSAFTIPDQKYIGIYGFFDLTPTPDLISMGFSNGSGYKDFWHVEHCYVGDVTTPAMGISRRPVYFKQNETMKWYLANKDGTLDTNTGLRALIVEKAGEVIA
jgi:hypothetical protein